VSDEPDAALLAAYVRGDEQAFESLFRRFEAEVFRWALRIVRDRAAADDVVVEAFWRAYRSRARFDPTRSFGAWIRRIATNVALDELKTIRTRATWVEIDEDVFRVSQNTTATPPWTVSGETRDAMARAFRSLPPKLLVVALLALVEQRPYEEIADALDVPVGTVKSRAFRAIRALREALTRLGVHR
jgi:RNA polymerase sigma-70 factor (ECF subfamily)